MQTKKHAAEMSNDSELKIFHSVLKSQKWFVALIRVTPRLQWMYTFIDQFLLPS